LSDLLFLGTVFAELIRCMVRIEVKRVALWRAGERFQSNQNMRGVLQVLGCDHAFILTIRMGLCFVAWHASAASCWFVDNAAAGANNGKDWTNAWNDFSSIGWQDILPGDVVFISGGVVSKAYTNTLWIRTAGLPHAPITIRVGTNAPHSGVVYLSNSIVIPGISYSNIVVDGGRNPRFDTNGLNPLTLWGITNNVGLVICPNNAPMINSSRQGILVNSATGIKLRWLEIHAGGDIHPANNGIIWRVPEAGDGLRHRENCEIAYCCIHHNTEDGINDASGAEQSDGLGRLVIHHNIVFQNADDGYEGTHGVDFCYNRMGGVHPTYEDPRGHPDTIQEPGLNVRIYNNIVFTALNSAIYQFPLAEWYETNGGNVFVYGNVVYNDGRNKDYLNGNLLGITARIESNIPDAPIFFRWTNIVFANNTGGNVDGGPLIKVNFLISRQTQPYRAKDSSFQVYSNGFILNNVGWRVNYGRFGASQAAISTVGAFKVDYNTLDNSTGGNTRWYAGTKLVQSYTSTGGIINTTSARVFNAYVGAVSNMNAPVRFVNAPSFDFRLQAGDRAARNRGIDLAAIVPVALLEMMPDYDKDMLGNRRGADGAWDRGAFECPSPRILR
jgi:hypothetical protein